MIWGSATVAGWLSDPDRGVRRMDLPADAGMRSHGMTLGLISFEYGWMTSFPEAVLPVVACVGALEVR